VAFLIVLFALPLITPPQRVPIIEPVADPEPAHADINTVIEAEFSHYSEEVTEELGGEGSPITARPPK